MQPANFPLAYYSEPQNNFYYLPMHNEDPELNNSSSELASNETDTEPLEPERDTDVNFSKAFEPDPLT